MYNGTRKLFYEDAYIAEFDTEVISCEPRGDGRYGVVLAATAFYPEGGGQPADTGVIASARVLDVRERDGNIVHETDACLDAGARVTGKLDWGRRFRLMQHHTGEHIVSGLVRRLYGYDNVGFHMGEEFTTMDINGELTAAQLNELELLANRAVYGNVRVSSRYPAADELRELDYRSKKALSGDVRIVTVDGYDDCACCGLHTAASGEVGVIKLAQTQKYKSGMRFYLLCGERALADYHSKNADMYALAQLFSVKPHEAVAAVQRCHDENAELKRLVAGYRFDGLRRKAEALAPAGALYMFEDGITPDEQRRLCLLLCEKAGIAAVITAVDAGFRYAVGSTATDVRGLGKRLNTELNGRGGGQPNLVQGTVSAGRERVEAFFKANIG